MAQSIPSVPIPSQDIFHFVLEKLQMPCGGARCSYKNPSVGLKNRVQMPHPQGPVPWKLIKFNPGLSQILSKVFLSKNMWPKLSKILLSFHSEIQ